LSKESVVNHDVGVDRLVQVGEAVTRGTTLARIHAADEAALAAAIDRLRPAIEVADEPLPPRERLVETLG
jgi:thymidine phosphorylase